MYIRDVFASRSLWWSVCKYCDKTEHLILYLMTLWNMVRVFTLLLSI